MVFCVGDADYISGPYDATFPAGVTHVSFDVSIKDDNIIETNETFSLIIISTTLPDRVIMGNPIESIVTIVDNDSK